MIIQLGDKHLDVAQLRHADLYTTTKSPIAAMGLLLFGFFGTISK